MFELPAPWWEFVLRAVMVYAALMVLVRLSGKRTIGEFTAFDLIVLILLGEAAAGGLTGGHASVTGSLLSASTLVGLNYLVGFASARSALIDKLVEGEPVVVLYNGELLREAMKKNNLPESDLDEALRKAGVGDRNDVSLAVLETDGVITVIRKIPGPNILSSKT